MTGWPPGLLQDDCKKLSKWLASKPDARYIVRKSIDMTDTKKDPHAELMRLADKYATVKFVEGIDGNEGRVETAWHVLDAFARTLTDGLERAERMFYAACSDLGAINQALGLDPDDGGAEPIIDAIKELQAALAAKDVQIEGLRSVTMELQRLMLVIESSVRNWDPANHAAVMVLITANNAAIAKEAAK